MDFWFIFKNPTSKFSLFYDGDPHKIRMTVSPRSAKKWIESFKEHEFVEDKLNVIGKYRISYNNVPIIDEWENVSVKFGEFLIESRISSVLMRAWSVFLKKYDVVYDWSRVWFREKKEYNLWIELPDWGLMRMKEFIFWLFRFNPIKLRTGKDKNGNDKFIDFNIAQHHNGKYEIVSSDGKKKKLKKIPYNYKWRTKETPLYWIYAPQMRELMFGNIMDFWDGRILQKRQMEFLYRMWEETYVAAARNSGKSFIVAFLASIYVMRTIANPREIVDWPIVHLYWISQPSNKAIRNKILKMNEKLRDWRLFKWSWQENTLYFIDKWHTVGWIEFLSDSGDEPWRWWRPTMIVIDEASRISDDTFKITLWQSNIPKIYVSTILHETKKNWFYNWLVRGEIMMPQYSMSNEDAIVHLWNKYGMDKYKTLEEINKKDVKAKLADMREEYFQMFPIVSLRYTIDDIEFMSKKEKEKRVKRNLEEWGLNYMLSENYSEILDEGALFEFQRWRIRDEDIPENFHMVVLSFDQADEFDNPVLVALWLKNMDVYVLDSIILPWDEVEQMTKLQDHTEYYERNHSNVYKIADCTQSPKAQKAYLEDRGWFIDMAFRVTNGGSARNTWDWFILIGKQLLISTAKSLFNRGAVKIADKFDVDNGLIFELENFQAVKTTSGNIKYEATKGKDDQVNATLFGLYFLSDYWLKEKIANHDNVIRIEKKGSQFERIEAYQREQRRQEELKNAEDAFDQLMVQHWY